MYRLLIGRVAARCIALTFALTFFGAVAQEYPNRAVRIVVAFPPGGPSDYAARVIAQKMLETLKQQVIVDNRPGGAGLIGAEHVVRSAPDGYTLLIGNLGMLSILPHLRAKMPFDALKDITPVTNLIGGPSFLLVHPSLPVKNIKDMIALAKKNPGQLTYASASVGQISHMNGELMKLLAGVDMLHVPYKGTGPIMPELISGQVSMTFSTAVENLNFVKAGRVRLLAVTGRQRLPMLPDTPTMIESGLPGFESLNWNGLVGPAGLRPEIAQRLHRESVRALNLPDVKEKILAQGNQPIGDTPAEFTTFIRAESDKWGKVVRTAKIKID